MEQIEKSIQVSVPASIAYSQWGRFTQLPLFTDGINDDGESGSRFSHWAGEVSEQPWDVKVQITEQIPNYRVAWRSTHGAPSAGVVSFLPIDDHTTQIILELSYEPDGVLERAGSILGIVSRRVESDLQHFKDLIEMLGEGRRHQRAVSIDRHSSPAGRRSADR
ncbi:MAG: SRPBCC family protein [Gammaproteobacteria bacterium]